MLSGCRPGEHKFDLERLDAIIGERFLLTMHRGRPVFLEAIRKSYLADFKRFAKTPSFLLYELWVPARWWWVAVVTVVGGLFWLMRRAKLL